MITIIPSLLIAALTTNAALPNLDFADGRLTHWLGERFYVTPINNRGPSLHLGACSSDVGAGGRTALLHRTFVVPPGAGAIVFTAAAVRPTATPEGPPLDIVLEAAGRRFIPCQVRTPNGWQATQHLLPLSQGKPREYLWPVEDLVGQHVRIALCDGDDRPGCYLICGGFRILAADERNGRTFAAFMLDLERRLRLAEMTRLESKHFLAIGNTADEFTEERLYNCETIHTVFFPHFRQKGFRLHEPSAKLMVAIFDSQEGFEAYLGQRMSSTITGIYHPGSNRLVVYDYARNRAFVDNRRKAAQLAGQINSSLDRQRLSGSRSRFAQTHRADANLGTIMHEVAHQLSFNSGLLNRQGDVPMWLAEGLACYCEATTNGSWQGVGESNPMRANALARPARGESEFIPLRSLLQSDDWLRRASDTQRLILGYSQSWALFRMLMEQRPRAFRDYLALIYERRTPEQRLADWTRIFGTNLTDFENAYLAYVRDVVRQEVRGGHSRP